MKNKIKRKARGRSRTLYINLTLDSFSVSLERDSVLTVGDTHWRLQPVYFRPTLQSGACLSSGERDMGRIITCPEVFFFFISPKFFG